MGDEGPLILLLLLKQGCRLDLDGTSAQRLLLLTSTVKVLQEGVVQHVWLKLLKTIHPLETLHSGDWRTKTGESPVSVLMRGMHNCIAESVWKQSLYLFHPILQESILLHISFSLLLLAQGKLVSQLALFSSVEAK